jgi:hypothetical protein
MLHRARFRFVAAAAVTLLLSAQSVHAQGANVPSDDSMTAMSARLEADSNYLSSANALTMREISLNDDVPSAVDDFTLQMHAAAATGVVNVDRVQAAAAACSARLQQDEAALQSVINDYQALSVPNDMADIHRRFGQVLDDELLAMDLTREGVEQFDSNRLAAAERLERQAAFESSALSQDVLQWAGVP